MSTSRRRRRGSSRAPRRRSEQHTPYRPRRRRTQPARHVACARVRLVSICLAGAALAAPCSAHAAVDLGDQRIVVSEGSTSAVIDRHPFRLAFADGAAQALSEVANSGEAPQPIPPTPQPIPLGNDTETRPTLYAPLQFTVGSARDFQYPGTQWNGNELAGTEAGVVYSARDVLDARVMD